MNIDVVMQDLVTSQKEMVNKMAETQQKIDEAESTVLELRRAWWVSKTVSDALTHALDGVTKGLEGGEFNISPTDKLK